MNKSTQIPKSLTAPKMKAIAALLECETAADAAKKARISRTALYQWLKDPEFTAILNEGREMIFTEALELLKAAAKMATDRLIEIVKSDDEGQARLAAVGILKFALQGSEFKDLESRISEIEKILEERISIVN